MYNYNNYVFDLADCPSFRVPATVSCLHSSFCCLYPNGGVRDVSKNPVSFTINTTNNNSKLALYPV